MSVMHETDILIAPPDTEVLTSEMLGNAITTVEYGEDGTRHCKYLGYTHKNGKRLYLFLTPTLSVSYDEKQLCAHALDLMKVARIAAAKAGKTRR
jgi:hypothetical protein